MSELSAPLSRTVEIRMGGVHLIKRDVVAAPVHWQAHRDRIMLCQPNSIAHTSRELLLPSAGVYGAGAHSLLSDDRFGATPQRIPSLP